MSNEINGLLVNFSITGGWTARARDKQVTEEVTSQHGTSEDAGAWSKNLFPDSMFELGEPNPYKQFKAAISKAKTLHYELTVPWEKPHALIKSSVHDRYDRDINVEARAEVEEKAAAFFAAYEGLIERARPKLNGTFNQDDYPPLDKLRRKFGYNVAYAPVPQSSHYADSVSEWVKRDLDAANDAKIRNAISDVWKRLLEPIQRLADKMVEPDPRFHDTIVQNVRDMVALVPDLNIVDDPALAEAARTIQDTLNTVNPETLRASQAARIETASKAIGLLSQFGNLGGRKLAIAA